MKVLDLHCEHDHVFEGWFASEEDYVAQSERAMVQCPLCGSAKVGKKLSAPRLNLMASRGDAVRSTEVAPAAVTPMAEMPGAGLPQEVVAAWLHIARKIVANTTDVGKNFAQEARKIHYGEAEDRAIRGQTTLDEAKELLEEGIDVMPLPLPDYLKEPLQ